MQYVLHSSIKWFLLYPTIEFVATLVYKLPTQPASGQIAIDCGMKKVKMSVDTGMMIVIFISMMYLAIVFVLLFYVGNEWCDLLYKNMTVLLDIRFKCFFKTSIQSFTSYFLHIKR